MKLGRLIRTPRLVVDTFNESHLTPEYVKWLNDPVITKYSENRHKKHTLDSCKAYWQSFQNTPHYFLAIEVPDLKRLHIGNITVYIDEPNGLADIGIILGERSFWGKGYGAEAWIGICDYLLRGLEIRKVTAGTVETNKAMVKIMEKSGMIEDGIRRKHHVWNSQMVDVIHKALFRETWLEKYPISPFP